MTFRTINRKLLRNYHDYGVKISTKKAFLNLLKPIYYNRSLIIYKIELKHLEFNESKKTNFIFKLVSLHDSSIIDHIEQMEEWLQGQLRSMLSEGRLCMAILNNNKVVGFYLASLHETIIPSLKLKVFLKKNEAWGDQITINKGQRRKSLATILRRNIYGELKRIGIEKVFGHIDIDNKPSLKAIDRFPFEIIGILHYRAIFKVLRMKFIRSTKTINTGLVSNCHYLKPINHAKHNFTASTSDFNV